MTAETQRTLVAAVRRVVVAGLVLLLIWLGLLGLRGAISADTISHMNEQLKMGSPAPAPLPLNPWSWDWSKSLFTGRPVAETVGTRVGTTLQLMTMGGLVSLLLAGILLLIGMAVSRATPRRSWLAKTRSVLRLIVVTGGSSLPTFVLGAFLVVYVNIWFGTGSEGRPNPGLNLLWSIITISLLPAWLLVQYGVGELQKLPAGHRLFDGARWLRLGTSLVIRLLKLVGAVAVVTMLVEQVWAQPGLGRQFVDAVNMRDFPVLFGAAWASALIVVLVKLAADLIEIGRRHLAHPRPETAQVGALAPREIGTPRWWPVVCFVLVGISLIVALAAPIIAPRGYNEMVLGARLQPPSSQYLLGTDNLGRDILSRLVFGIRQDLFVAILAVAIMFVVAIGWAMLAAYVRRRNDWQGDTLEDLVMLPKDVLCAFPWLVLLLLLVNFGAMATSGPVKVSLFALPPILTISLALLPRAVGVMQEAYRWPPEGKQWLHSLLLSIPIMIVFAVAGGVVYLATMGFLGFGTPPPAPELGAMLTGPARRYMLQAPWIGSWPSAALLLLLLAWVMTGEVLLERLGFRSKAVWSKVWE
jgi:peptide/nickel transport system permease protein